MKIFLVTNDLSGKSGWSRYALDLAESFQEKGYQVVCFVDQKTEETNLEEYILPTSIHRMFLNPFGIYKVARFLQKEINKTKPDVVHFVAEPFSTSLVFMFIPKKVKTVLTVHGTYSYMPALFSGKFRKRLIKFYTGIVFKKVDVIISVSGFTKKYLLEKIDKNYENINKKIFVVTNWVKFLPKEKSNIKTTNNIKNILFVGGVKKRKGVLESIRALGVYKKKYNSNFIFNIVGTLNEKDAYYKNLIKNINEEGLDSNIKFTGVISDAELKSYYKQADVFLMPSINDGKHFEGFGLVFLEANMYGVPCIGAKNSGAEDAIVDNKTGFLVESQDRDYIAERLCDVLERHKIKELDCLNWVSQNTLKEKMIQIEKIYKETNLNIY